MSEFKGTKGKAKLFNECFENKYNFYVQPISISSSNKILFANAYGKTKEETEYNAKLIACASEMLEMLHKCNALLLRVQSPATACLFMSQDIKQLIKKATE